MPSDTRPRARADIGDLRTHKGGTSLSSASARVLAPSLARHLPGASGIAAVNPLLHQSKPDGLHNIHWGQTAK
jgi:hypothetical protein